MTFLLTPFITIATKEIEKQNYHIDYIGIKENTINDGAVIQEQIIINISKTEVQQ